MADFAILQALAEIVSKTKVKHIHVIGNPDSKNTKFEQFYRALAEGLFQNDEEAAEFFYHSPPNNAAYQKLKNRLQERLINTLFFIDVTQSIFNEYHKAYFTSYKILAAVRILVGRNARNAAISIAEKALEMALKFDLTDVAFSLSRELCVYYGSMKGIKEKYKVMSEILEKQSVILMAEIKAEKYMSDLIVNFAKTKAAQPDLIEEAKKYSAEIDLIAQNIHSFRFNYMAFLIKATYYEIANNYKNLILVCKDALAYFDTKKEIVPLVVQFSFTYRQLIGHIQLKNYNEGRIAAEKCLKLVEEGTNNWFLALNYHILLAFHTENFQEAYQISQKALSHPKLKNQVEQIVEYWKILEAYIYYLISIKKITPDADNPVKKFRINKFVNEVVIYKKDKSGANIAVLILQILFLLNEQKYNGIIDRTEALKSYQQRYLRNDETFRSQCFIRMLILMSECSFNKKATLRKTEKLWTKLQSKPINIAEQSADIEPIPYETLWGFVLDALDEKWH